MTWTGYSVYDAASCLLRYLKRLPEPVIPFNFYNKFTSILDPTCYEQDEDKLEVCTIEEDVAIRTLQQYITEIPPLNRHLLNYLLDVSAVFAKTSNTNKMTTRMVAALQPALLAREPDIGMSIVDHMRAADTLVFMIQNHEHFLVGHMPSTGEQNTTITSDSTALAEKVEDNVEKM